MIFHISTQDLKVRYIGTGTGTGYRYLVRAGGELTVSDAHHVAGRHTTLVGLVAHAAHRLVVAGYDSVTSLCTCANNGRA